MSEDVKSLLIELGTEELPPKSLKTLAQALADSIKAGIAQAQLQSGEIHVYATPRRIAVIVDDLQTRKPDTLVERRGPALKIAFDKDGNATSAAQGFAKSCGVTVDELERLDTHLMFKQRQAGMDTADIITEILEKAIQALPIAKRMRWADGDDAFVRPLHWLVLLYGDEVIPCTLFGVVSSYYTYGHRFHHPDAIRITSPKTYVFKLAEKGYVLADMDVRRDTISNQITQLATKLGGQVVVNEALLDDVTALTEYPVALSGAYDKGFLTLPSDVLICSMETHQKYFAVKDKEGKLMPYFITVCNIDSQDKDAVIKGNERVITARLSDAAFFYQQDSKSRLQDRRDILKTIVYHDKLGSLSDKADRIARLAVIIANTLGRDTKRVERAAYLAKCDLVTDMVTEFPNLQGVMGRDYARKEGEEEEVASAIEEQYLPRFAGDRLPQTQTGQVLSLANKLETLVGLFGIGELPTGTSDPFALRRASLGVIRIMIEYKLSNLRGWVQDTLHLFPDGVIIEDDVLEKVMVYIYERLRSSVLDEGVAADVFSAVSAIKPNDPLDFQRRLDAVNQFVRLEQAPALVASNKRINNILSKHGSKADAYRIDASLLREQAEQQLAAKLNEVDADIGELLVKHNYTDTLIKIADMQPEIDNFFANVMVMTDDEAVCQNRLNLLAKARRLFLSVADVSRLNQ